MTYENFLKVILHQQKMDYQVTKAYELKIDLVDFVDGYHHIISTLIKEIYGEDGYEWYSWFCYESDYGTKEWSKTDSYKIDKDGKMILEHKAGEVRFGAYDEKGNPICYSFESLWGYLELNCKVKEVTQRVKKSKYTDGNTANNIINEIFSKIFKNKNK